MKDVEAIISLDPEGALSKVEKIKRKQRKTRQTEEQIKYDKDLHEKIESVRP